MPINNPIKTPAGYVPAFALGFSGPEGELEIVESTKPLPVAIASTDPLTVRPEFALAPSPLEGTRLWNHAESEQWGQLAFDFSGGC